MMEHEEVEIEKMVLFEKYLKVANEIMLEDLKFFCTDVFKIKMIKDDTKSNYRLIVLYLFNYYNNDIKGLYEHLKKGYITNKIYQTGGIQGLRLIREYSNFKKQKKCNPSKLVHKMAKDLGYDAKTLDTLISMYNGIEGNFHKKIGQTSDVVPLSNRRGAKSEVFG